MPVMDASASVEALTQLPTLLRQVAGWTELTAALAARRSGSIDGTWGSSAALATASLALEVPQTLLVVLAHPGDLEAWHDDLYSLLGIEPLVFPAWESWPIDPKALVDDTPGQRLRVMQKLASETPPKLVLSTIAALMQPVPEPAELAKRGRKLQVGKLIDLETFLPWLIEHGYKRVDAVELPGEFSRRGGILDIFSPDAEHPVRLELFGDEIEAIRPFSVATQRSLGDWKEVAIIGKSETHRDGQVKLERGHLADWLPSESWIALVEPSELQEQGKFFLERVPDPVGLFSTNAVFQQAFRFPNIILSTMPTASIETTCHLRVESVERFSGNVQQVRDELDGIASSDRVLIACHNEAEIHRLQEVLAAGKLAQSDRLRLTVGHVHAGFRLVDLGIVVLGSHELFHRDPAPIGEKSGASAAQRRIESRAIDSFLDLNEGDYVVHVAHGIAIFRGMAMLPSGTSHKPAEAHELTLRESEEDEFTDAHLRAHAKEEHLVLEFRDGGRLYVPVSKIDLVQRYIGGSRTQPELSKLGGTSWAKRKEKVEAAVRDLAAEMIEMQAIRASQPGFAYPPDSPWQIEFESTFPYQETPDQLTAIQEIKADMQRPRPMDRLLCGDVGFGKTEMAIRAAFKAIDNGKQVAVLVPTTVLADQHFRTFRSRLAEYPFTVEMLSRFRTAAEQKRILKGLKEGTIDVVIGTHRLVSDDVRFKDLGLVIIDEEQRFGVEHKEKLKRLRAMVDVLTMSATPIPRTLNQALLGIREISNLETPPLDRLPIETRIIRWDDQLIRHAILRELNREGQVYFVHNRVYDIQQIAQKLQRIVPEAKIVVAHGQMNEGELERAMLQFVRQEADILVATTIIESGVDIPNANTIFIDQADTYGLANLHQLRGRVGRQKNRAYAYLLLDGSKTVSTDAAKRLKAIEEYSELGAGFKIAMRDLEIRGAGNILGTEQSGHIEAVGYELYCQLLENAVRHLKKQPIRTHIETTVDLPWPAYLPRDYVPGQKMRIEVYRRLARLRDPHALSDFRQELRDRYGPLPEAAEWMLKLAEIRLLASRWQILSIHRDNKDLVFSYRDRRLADRLAAHSGGRLKVVDDKSLYCRLRPDEEDAITMYQLLQSVLRSAEQTV